MFLGSCLFFIVSQIYCFCLLIQQTQQMASDNTINKGNTTSQLLFNSGGDKELVSAESDADIKQLLPSQIDFSMRDTESFKSFSVPQPNTKAIRGTNLDISVSDPRKVGTGISSFLLFTVITKSTSDVTVLSKTETSVERRFRDFVALQEKLRLKYSPLGIIVPPGPDKRIGNTFIRFPSYEENISEEFMQKRRGAMERFLNRIAAHPVLCQDVDFHVFLEQEGLMSTNRSSAFHPIALTKWAKTVWSRTSLALTDSYFKQQKDDWFQTKLNMIECLDQQTRFLRCSYNKHVQAQKDFALELTQTATSLTILGKAENDPSFSDIISGVAEAMVKIGDLQQKQSNVDIYCVTELLYDHLKIFEEIKELHQVREQLHYPWVESHYNVINKKECVKRMEGMGAEFEAELLGNELKKLEETEQRKKEKLDSFTSAFKTDMRQFQKNYAKEFKHISLVFLQQMMKNLELTINIWETVIPETTIGESSFKF